MTTAILVLGFVLLGAILFFPLRKLRRRQREQLLANIRELFSLPADSPRLAFKRGQPVSYLTRHGLRPVVFIALDNSGRAVVEQNGHFVRRAAYRLRPR